MGEDAARSVRKLTSEEEEGWPPGRPRGSSDSCGLAMAERVVRDPEAGEPAPHRLFVAARECGFRDVLCDHVLAEPDANQSALFGRHLNCRHCFFTPSES